MTHILCVLHGRECKTFVYQTSSPSTTNFVYETNSRNTHIQNQQAVIHVRINIYIIHSSHFSPRFEHLSLQVWDLDALEESTHYDGFNVDHPVIM